MLGIRIKAKDGDGSTKRKGTKNLTWTQRIQLEMLLKEGLHKKLIAEQLGISLSTIYRE